MFKRPEIVWFVPLKLVDMLGSIIWQLKKEGRKSDALGTAAPSFCSLFFHRTDKFSVKYLWKSYETVQLMHLEKRGAHWKCFSSEFGVRDLFLKHLLKEGVVLLVCLLLSAQTLQWTDSTAEEWPEKYLLAFSGLVGWDIPGKALTTEACTKQRAESMWPRQEKKREGACWGSFIQCAW